MLRELLSPNGGVFVHLDQRKAHYIKTILDEVFGEHNFRNEIMLPGRASKNLQQQFETISRLNVRHDTLLWYSRTGATKFGKLWIQKHNAGNPEGHWHHFWSTADRQTMRYELFGVTPKTGQWVWGKETGMQAVENYERFLEEGGGRTLAEYWRDTGSTLRFVRRNPEDGSPQYWRAPAKDRLADTVWAGIPVYASSTKYPTEKNEALLAQVIELASDEGDLVLDAFAGSGTTPAVGEKLGRRWIAIDSGKLAVHTIQKRMLSLKAEIGNKGKSLSPKPFDLCNAGLYDFATLKTLPWKDWRFFALALFECRDEPHVVNGLTLDGKRRGASVLVFNHHERPGQRVDEEFVQNIHEIVGGKGGDEFCIVAPKAVFDFQQDYLEMDGVRYYALRIPYSFISELHRRSFSALKQPSSEGDVNGLVDSYGFDFIVRPTFAFETGIITNGKGLFTEAYLKITQFQSHSKIKGEEMIDGKEALSMLMLDFNYDGEVFDFDAVFYAHQLAAADWTARFPEENLGAKMMAVFIDIHGNEAQEVIGREKFAPFVDINGAGTSEKE